MSSKRLARALDRGGRRGSSHPLAASVLVVLIIAGSSTAAPPPTRFWEGDHLERVRLGEFAGDQRVAKSLDQLRRAADDALERGPYTVVDKEVVPPSGDKHDYLSLSRYWWPNPNTEDGLPFVRRDGVVNRESVRTGDRVRLGEFSDDFQALSLAAYLIDAERYAPYARLLLRTWFLDRATRMSPHLRYAQGVPGVADGRSPGVIDTRCFIWLLDGVVLLEQIEAIEASDRGALEWWFREYLDWLLTSKLGTGERRAKNNHGMWFAAQALRVALFIGDEETARLIAERTKDRIADGIQADGSQPEELRRTRSLHYSLFSLSALTAVARMAETLDIDLWNYESDTGASLAVALDYAAPHAVDGAAWPYPSLGPYCVSDQGSPLFYLAATRFGRADLLDLYDRIPKRADRGARILTPLSFAREP